MDKEEDEVRKKFQSSGTRTGTDSPQRRKKKEAKRPRTPDTGARRRIGMFPLRPPLKHGERMLARGPRRPAYASPDYVARNPAPLTKKDAEWEDEDGRLYRIDMIMHDNKIKATCKLPGKRMDFNAVHRPESGEVREFRSLKDKTAAPEQARIEAVFFGDLRRATGYVFLTHLPK